LTANAPVRLIYILPNDADEMTSNFTLLLIHNIFSNAYFQAHQQARHMGGSSLTIDSVTINEAL